MEWKHTESTFLVSYTRKPNPSCYLLLLCCNSASALSCDCSLKMASNSIYENVEPAPNEDARRRSSDSNSGDNLSASSETGDFISGWFLEYRSYIEVDSESSSWTRSIREFNSTEEEIAFYKSEIERLQREDTKVGRRLLEVLLELGICYSSIDENEKAEEELLKVRAKFEEVWGWDHLASQAYVKALAQVFEALGKLEDAYQLYDAAIAGVSRALGREYPWTIELMNNAACLHYRQLDLDRAETLFSEAYRAKRHVFGPDHRVTLDTLCNLSVLSSARGEHDQRYQDELSSMVKRLRKYHDANVKMAAKHLINLYLRTNNADEARKLHEALEIEGKLSSSIL